MSITAIRYKLYDYIRVADEKKLNAIYHLLEKDIEQSSAWWNDKQMIQELERRDQALEDGTDTGVTAEQLEQAVSKLRLKKYGR